ncbi:hypothetical protein BH11PSE4_BH11PSE4_41150 [soil metagenome]
MFKKFAFIAVAAVISSGAVVASAAPAAAQGISVQLGNGGGYRDHRDGYRGDGFRRGRAEYVRRDRGHHRGWDRRPRGRTVIIER